MTPDLSYDYEGENRRAKITNGMVKKKKGANLFNLANQIGRNTVDDGRYQVDMANGDTGSEK